VPDRVGCAPFRQVPRPPLRLPRVRLRAEVVVPALLVTVGLALGLGMVWAWADAPSAPAGNDLLADVSSPKLDATSAEAPARLSEPTPQPDVATTSSTQPPGPVPEPLAVAPEPIPAPEPSPVPEVVVVPPAPEPPILAEAVQVVAEPMPPTAEPYDFRSYQPGESIMMRNWKALGLQTILLAAFTTAEPAPVPAQAPTAKEFAELKETVQKMDKGLAQMYEANKKLAGDIAKDIGGLRESLKLIGERLDGTQTTIDKLKDDVAKLRQEVDTLKKEKPQVSGYGPASKELDELKKNLEQLQKSLEGMRNGSPQTRTALRPGDKGRLELINDDYPVPIDIVVNDKAYRVQPGETRVVELAVGSTFTYRIPSIPGYQANLTRVLGGERPHQIIVHRQ
jgi:archaellum component FlaC